MTGSSLHSKFFFSFQTLQKWHCKFKHGQCNGALVLYCISGSSYETSKVMSQVLHQFYFCSESTLVLSNNSFSNKSYWLAEWLIKCSFMSLKFFHHLSRRMCDWADQLPHHKAPAANLVTSGCVTNCFSYYTQ